MQEAQKEIGIAMTTETIIKTMMETPERWKIILRYTYEGSHTKWRGRRKKEGKAEIEGNMQNNRRTKELQLR